MPERVMKALGIKKDQVVADIGAGDGYFTFRIAEKVGSKGQVYAVEINQSMIEKLKSKAQEKGVSNVKVVLGDAGDPHLPESAFDVILFVETYHEVEDKPEMLKRKAYLL